MPRNILIVGATRGLGASLRVLYSKSPSNHVFGTTRSSSSEPTSSITWLTGIDVAQPDVGQKIVSQLPSSTKLSTVIITAGYFGFETFDEPDWEKQVRMYTTSAVGPVFVVQNLVKAGLLGEGSKVILVSSESGSITLRHEKEGGGNFGHHASKSALNMVGKLLSLDLKPKGIAVGLVHPGFMRTEMTKSIGFDKYWDAGGGKKFISHLRPWIYTDVYFLQLLLRMKQLNHLHHLLIHSTLARQASSGHHGDLGMNFPFSRHQLNLTIEQRYWDCRRCTRKGPSNALAAALVN